MKQLANLTGQPFIINSGAGTRWREGKTRYKGGFCPAGQDIMSGRDAIDQVMQETGLQLIMKSERIKPDFIYKIRPVSAVDPVQLLYTDPGNTFSTTLITRTCPYYKAPFMEQRLSAASVCKRCEIALLR